MNINSHIQLPNLILQHFRDESDPEKKVWYLDIHSGEILRKSAKRLGTSKGYYSEIGEEFWAQNIESPLGELNAKIIAFCKGEAETIDVGSEDIVLAKQYIKSAAVRSSLAYRAMKEESFAACLFSEQATHDMLSFFGMRPEPRFDQQFEDLTLTIIANRTEHHLVVPRNCYYCVSHWNVRNFVAPISPQCAILLLPIEHLQLADNGYAVIDDPAQVDIMNVLALKYECMFNADFVASDRRTELELLQQFRRENLAVLEAMKIGLT